MTKFSTQFHNHSRGKVVGGSSAINALALIYPPKSSIDAWKHLGDEGWDWDAMAPYHRKFHTFNRPSKETAEALGTGYIDEDIQGRSGPIQSSFPEFQEPLGKAWPQTFKNLNLPLTSDPLSGQATGGFGYLSTIDTRTWAIQSPQLLELSGIGSSRILRSAGIEVFVDNLKLLDQYVQHTALATDPLSLFTQYAILRSILESSSEASVIIGMGASQMHFDQALQKDIYAITEPENYVSFLVALAQPFSRGSVHITSASISDPPKIDPRYLSHPLDIEILARHMQSIPKIAGMEPLASLINSGGRRLPEGIDLRSLSSAKDHCRPNIITNNHSCGTCAMKTLEKGGGGGSTAGSGCTGSRACG
ncbi:MAG: hypothetical protein Q9207_005175 [Kuettlingeria erythrocarpa]